MGVMPNVNNIGTSPVLVWSPGSNRETQRIVNIGRTVLFLGGSGVDPGNGLSLPPGSEVNLVGNSSPLYAITATGGPAAGGGSTTLSAAVAAGVTTVAVTSATNFATGDTVIIGSGSDAEVRKVTVSGTNFSFTGGLLYDHAVTDTVVEITVSAQGSLSLAVGLS